MKDGIVYYTINKIVCNNNTANQNDLFHLYKQIIQKYKPDNVLLSNFNNDLYNKIHNENDKNSIIHDDLQKVLKDSIGNIWVGGNKGFSLLDKKQDANQSTFYFLEKDLPIFWHIYSSVKNLELAD